MNPYDFLLALGFWQWVGVLMLAAIVAAGATDIVSAIFRSFRSKP